MKEGGNIYLWSRSRFGGGYILSLVVRGWGCNTHRVSSLLSSSVVDYTRACRALRKTGPQCVESFPHAATKQGISPPLWLSTWLHTPRCEQRAMSVIDGEIEESLMNGKGFGLEMFNS